MTQPDETAEPEPLPPDPTEAASPSQFVPAVRRKGASVTFRLDGRDLCAHDGQSVLSAVLEAGHTLRYNEFSGEPRAGFCLMNACQDCWIWTARGTRLRACQTPVSAGLELHTSCPATPEGT